MHVAMGIIYIYIYIVMKNPCIRDHGGATFTLNCDEARQQGQGLEHRTKNTVTLKGKGAEIQESAACG